MRDLTDGESTEMKGSGAKPYVLKNTGGVYSCSCPAWRNQNTPIERRTCKHLRKLRGDAAEEARLGGALPQKPVKQKSSGDGDSDEAAGPPLLLAESWDNAADLSGWWMSEKLDGVRAYWDGSQFLSRQGNLFHAPDFFLDGLPDVPLDGELWIDRRKFQRTVSIVRRQDKCELWSEVKFLVFDAPALNDVFEQRIAFIIETLTSRKKPLKFAQPHEHQLCKDLDCLRAELARVEALGGEGLMLRQPRSKYEAGRSGTLLKVKRFHDAEAVVTGHQDGLGRHKGRLGALLVKLPNGIAFSVGTGFSDRERSAPPPIGATITFRYQELSEAGVPRFPSYVGVRLDAGPAAPPTRLAKAPVKIPVTAPAKTASRGSGGTRRFEFTEGNSSKFWEVTQSGCHVTTSWGRIGTAGQSKTRTFSDESAATAESDRLVEEKTVKGYVER